VIGTLGSAAIGFGIGQAYDGTALPFLIGFAVCSILGFLIVVATDPRKMFAAIRVDTSADPTPLMPDDLC
jgi:DHA1 family bicyclomycin/chloramphenicol resistance-like MFS transporter